MICTSDWHLDVSTGGVRRFDDVCAAAWTTAEAAVDERADAFAFLGDLADPEDGASALRCAAFAVEIAAYLAARGIESVWIAGNHCCAESGTGTTLLSPLASSGVAHVFQQPARFQVCGVPCMALPFTESTASYDPAAFVRAQGAGVQIVFGHLNLEGIGPGSETTDMPRGRDVFWPLAVLREVCPNALLLGGHYHRRQVHNGVQIIGAPARFTFGEATHEPAFLVIEV